MSSPLPSPAHTPEFPPFRETWFTPPQVVVSLQDDTVLLRTPDPLMPVERNLIAMLLRAAAIWPDRPFLSERDAAGSWRTLSFAEFANAVSRAAPGLPEGQRIGVLTRNSIAAAVATFAIMARGRTAVPLAPAYLAHADGVALLNTLVDTVELGPVIVDDDLLDGLRAAGVQLGGSMRALSTVDTESSAQAFDLATAARLIEPGVTAKILFTSGSTGTPKAVPNTHGMLCASAAMIEQMSPASLDGQPYTQVDWLPWHHTYGGNVNLHGALSAGGHFHVDDGAPTPAGFSVMLRNLAEVGPNVISTVPAAFPPMLDAMEEKPALAQAILRNLSACAFGGAPLNPAVAERFQRLAIATVGRRIMFGSGYGMTETAGIIALVYWPTDRSDLLGLPMPGVEMKLVPQGDGRYECRVRGANIFSGYPGDEAAAFDENGFFKTGDAVRPANTETWEDGLVYAGRLAEDFKLANGVWICGGALRADLQAHLGPDCRDVLIVGVGRDEVGALVLTAPGSELRGSALIEAVDRFNAIRTGVSRRIGRVATLASAPDPDRGEVNAKGSLNVGRATQTRTTEIEALYVDDASRVSVNPTPVKALSRPA